MAEWVDAGHRCSRQVYRGEVIGTAAGSPSLEGSSHGSSERQQMSAILVPVIHRLDLHPLKVTTWDR